MTRYEYMRLKLADMPNNVIEHYKLRNVATLDGYIHCEIQKGMYGLPQAGIIAQQLLAKQLKEQGYYHSRSVDARVATHHLFTGCQQFWSQICW